MSERRLTAARGALLTPLPDGGVRLLRDGLLVYDGAGRIVHAGPALARFARAEQVAGSRRALIAAPFWDPHIHLPQLELAGRYREPLLTWLSRRVWPAEERHRNPATARRATAAFFRALAEAGTAGAGIFTAPFAHAAREALAQARSLDRPVRVGVPLMNRGTPGLDQPLGRWRRVLAELDAAHGTAAAVAPRFGLSCTPALMTAAGGLARRRRWVLTHLSETREEVAAVRARRLAPTYAGLYDRYRLLGARTLLAHGVWLADGELELLRRRRCWLVHCPTSNQALGSGRMPLERVRSAGVRWCLASDVGAGPDPCMLDAMRTAIAVQRHTSPIDPEEAYHRATLAPATALGYGARRGALLPGRSADFLVIDRCPGGAGASAGRVIEAWLARGGGRDWRGVAGRLYLAGRAAA